MSILAKLFLVLISCGENYALTTPLSFDEFVDWYPENAIDVENTNQWDRDELLSDRWDERVKMAQVNDSWGSIGDKLREHILANLHPKLDYWAVLRKFRTSILSQQRRLTRMKPNRCYGFAYMGSRRDFTTHFSLL